MICNRMQKLEASELEIGQVHRDNTKTYRKLQVKSISTSFNLVLSKSNLIIWQIAFSDQALCLYYMYSNAQM